MVKIKYLLILSFFLIGCPDSAFNGHHKPSDCIYSSGKLHCTIHDPRGTIRYNLYELPNSYCQKAGLLCEANSTVKPEITSIKVSDEVQKCFDSISADSSSTTEERQTATKCIDLLK